MSPDSFSKDGKKHSSEGLQQALQMIDNGADIIDIGGESTRPQSRLVREEEEISRVIPIIKHLREVSDVPISIDSYKSNVTRIALENGATWINDIWGLRYDQNMVDIAIEFDCPIVIMHNSRKLEKDPLNLPNNYNYTGTEYVVTIIDELKLSITHALEKGIKSSNIIVDPGIGFGKNAEQNIWILKYLERFKRLSYPLLVGTSRKRFVGEILGGRVVENRLEGTVATVATSMMRGANIMRVHDVAFIANFLKALDYLER